MATSLVIDFIKEHAFVLALLSTLSCGGPGIGAPCEGHGDCDDKYQCLAEVCAPRCESNHECGEGYRCSEKGLCNLVLAEIGDRCHSEWDCGPTQSCMLSEVDADGNGQLDASCQQQGEGSNVGSLCSADNDCRSYVCSLGHCSQVCLEANDCPSGTSCVSIPRITSEGDGLYQGCLQNAGVLQSTLTMEGATAQLLIPVPSSAKSLALVAQVNDGSHIVGATRVVSPSGQVLFRDTGLEEDFLTSPIRYSRARHVSTLLIPNTNTLSLETGLYKVDIEASIPPFGPGTAIPEISVFYKLNQSRILDLHFYFLNLADHPCSASLTGGTLDAQNVASSDGFGEKYVGEIRSIFSQANIPLGTIEYTDVDRPDLDGIVGVDDLHNLLKLAQNETGIAIFFVRSLSPDGVQTLGTTIPGPPRSPGTVSSGIAVSVDSLCYRNWETMARITAHGMASQMGLWQNRDPRGIPDPISDSDLSRNNLMFFGEFGGTELSPGQRSVLGHYPGLR